MDPWSQLPASSWPAGSTIHKEYCTNISKVRVQVPFKPSFSHCLSGAHNCTNHVTFAIHFAVQIYKFHIFCTNLHHLEVINYRAHIITSSWYKLCMALWQRPGLKSHSVLNFSGFPSSYVALIAWLWRWIPHRNVEMSVTNNSPSQDSNQPGDLFQSRYVTCLLYTSPSPRDA